MGKDNSVNTSKTFIVIQTKTTSLRKQNDGEIKINTETLNYT